MPVIHKKYRPEEHKNPELRTGSVYKTLPGSDEYRHGRVFTITHNPYVSEDSRPDQRIVVWLSGTDGMGTGFDMACDVLTGLKFVEVTLQEV